MLKLDSAIVRNEKVPYRIIEEEAILVNIERGNVVQLNEVAAFIWDKLNNKKKISEVVDYVCDSFEVEKGKAQKDVLEFLNELFKRRLIMRK